MNPNDSFNSVFLYATISGCINRSELVTWLFNPWMARMLFRTWDVCKSACEFHRSGRNESGRFAGTDLVRRQGRCRWRSFCR